MASVNGTMPTEALPGSPTFTVLMVTTRRGVPAATAADDVARTAATANAAIATNRTRIKARAWSHAKSRARKSGELALQGPSSPQALDCEKLTIRGQSSDPT